MNIINKQKYEIIHKLNNCAEEFHKNLESKKIMFVYEENNKNINYIETMFLSYNFFHLTGLKIINPQILNSKIFYQKLLKKQININDFQFKNNISKWKLEILPQIIKIEKLANQIGVFANSGKLLKTDILVGTTRNSCLGLKFIEKNQIYVPNTVLKEDIRKITTKRNRIVAILKENLRKSKYEKITYMAKNTNIETLFQNKELLSKIDVEKITKVDNVINII